VGPPSDGIAALVLGSGRAFIAVPRDRPFDEQDAKADRLQALGLAVVIRGWPSADRWPALLEQAAARPGQGGMALVSGSARRTASWLVATARSAL
jgi:predicted glycosyltransferase